LTQLISNVRKDEPNGSYQQPPGSNRNRPTETIMANAHLRADSVRANPTIQPISLANIRRVCRLHSVAETRFGREAVNDPRLIYDLMNGRELRPATLVRVAAYISSLEGR
jgi:hypothetical protein